MVTVGDTGTGMDAATLARAVKPFFTTKPVGKGTGLGLAMAHTHVTESGGALRLISELGQGTTVELWLRRAVAPRAA
jgi:signal transduction histidine kinase